MSKNSTFRVFCRIYIYARFVCNIALFIITNAYNIRGALHPPSEEAPPASAACVPDRCQGRSTLKLGIRQTRPPHSLASSQRVGLRPAKQRVALLCMCRESASQRAAHGPCWHCPPPAPGPQHVGSTADHPPNTAASQQVSGRAPLLASPPPAAPS